MLRSRAGEEWVRAPTETKSTPVAAISATVSSVTPPEASSSRAAGTPRGGDGLPQLGGTHVVEQQPVSPGLCALPNLVEVAALDFDRQAGLGLAGTPHRLPHTARNGCVVLLDQDRVVETHPVVGPAARRHRGLLQRPQSRGCLPRVEDPGPRALDSPNEPRGQGRDPGEVAEQVERGPLRGEQRSRRAGGSRDLRGNLVPPLGLGGDRLELTGARLPEDLGRDVESEQHPGRLLGDRRAPGGVLGDHRLGGDVTGP